MSTNKTQNYNLHKWEADDDFLRTEFNENFAAIDAAIADKPEVVVGSLTGTGEAMTIELGFQPKAVIYEQHNGVRYNGNAGLAVIGSPVIFSREGIVITETGFQLSESNAVITGETYNYIAIR